jgi:hypothetical protein
MNGGAEIFIGYRYLHLDVYEYVSDAGGDLIVEIFTMKGSDDAYGLQSLDRTGKCIDLTGDPPEDPSRCRHPAILYGGGYLRLWAAERFARLLAYQESEASRKALLTLAARIAEERTDPVPPQIVSALAEEIGPGLRLDPEKLIYLRSPLVLGSFSSIDPDNTLGLGLDTEVLRAVYRSEDAESTGDEMEVLRVRYPSETAARRADEQYRAQAGGGPGEPGDLWQEQDHWCGARNRGTEVLIVRNAPAREHAETFLESTAEATGESR